MTDTDKLLDSKSWQLLAALQADARLPLKTLATAAGLSISAAAERLRKLEDAGVIRGYRAALDLQRLGLGVEAVIGITVPQPQKRRFLDHLAALPSVRECLHVTGADSYLLRVAVADMHGLEALIETLNPYGETRTSLVLSTPIALRAVPPPA